MSRYLLTPSKDTVETLLPRLIDRDVEVIRKYCRHADPLIVDKSRKDGVDADNNRYIDPEQIPLYLSQLLDDLAILKEKIKEVPEKEFNKMPEYTDDGNFTLSGQIKHIYLMLDATREFWSTQYFKRENIPSVSLDDLDILLHILRNYKAATQEDIDTFLQAMQSFNDDIESHRLIENIFDSMYQKYEVDDELWDYVEYEYSVFSEDE